MIYVEVDRRRRRTPPWRRRRWRRSSLRRQAGGGPGEHRGVESSQNPATALATRLTAVRDGAARRHGDRALGQRTARRVEGRRGSGPAGPRAPRFRGRRDGLGRRRRPRSTRATCSASALPSTSREPLITRVVIDLARKIPYTVESVGDELRVLFTRAAEAATAPVAPAAAPAAATGRGRRAGAARPAPSTPVREDAPVITNTDLAPAAASPGDAGPGTNAAQTDDRRSAARRAAAGGRDGQRRASRATRSRFDFQGADLRAVLRTFAEISGLNIVIDPTINGHGRRLAARRAVGSGARHHSQGQQARLRRRRHGRAHRAARRCWRRKKRSGAS